jgi:hypothetical protein
MARLTVETTPSWRYQPRTITNAKESTLTIIFCVDSESSGTKLTKSYTKQFHIVNVHNPVKYEYAKMKHIFGNNINTSIVNVAGNGISAYVYNNISQSDLNTYVTEFLRLLNNEHKISLIRSGGQTGADVAGVSASIRLSIDCVVLMPRGYRQRLLGFVDKYYSSKADFLGELGVQIM